MLTQDKILSSLQHVVNNSRHVSINQRRLEEYVKNFRPTKKLHWSDLYPLGYKRRGKDEDEMDFLFLTASQAFCFWGYPQKWTISYKEKALDGWWALVACFERALAKGVPILEGEYLAKLSFKDVKKLFDGEPEIPLFKERKKMLNKIGKVLDKKYQGRFHNFFRQANDDVFPFIESLAKEFAGFDDVAEFKGKPIYLYKKAQLVVTDILNIFKEKNPAKFKNFNQLTGHADYKVPMVLNGLEILVYDEKLSEKIRKRQEIKSGSEMEVEIRANMLWVIHLITEGLKSKFPDLSAADLCGVLWNQSQKVNINQTHYHFTKTIYY